MNLKEAFRYQKFIDGLMADACNAMRSKQLCLNTEKTHYYSKADSTVSDVVEVEEKTVQYRIEDLVHLCTDLIDERYRLTHAINEAKANAAIDIDASVEENKFVSRLTSSLKFVFNYSAGKRKETGRGYRLNVEGAQVPYVYDIDVVDTEAYDKKYLRTLNRDLSANADRVSTEIDLAMVNTTVDFVPAHDVNESLDDIIAVYVQNRLEAEEAEG